jgi:hypothetical protein
MILRYGWAAVLLGLATSLVSGQMSSSAGPGFRVAGRVINALGGDPLSGARVALQDTRNPEKVAQTFTSEDGRFEFNHVEAGKYDLRGARKGFIAASYEQHEQFSTAIVTGAGVDTEHLTLGLAPFAVLSGKVLDEAGDGVREAGVSLYAEDRETGVGRIHRVRSESTDDQGTYEFSGLEAGTYFLTATASPWYAVHPTSVSEEVAQQMATAVDQSLDVAYPVFYYKDVTEPDDASPIPVRAGDRLEADIHLSPVPALHLIFHMPENGQHGFNLPMLQRPSFDGMQQVPVRAGGVVSPGIVEITGIAAGRYLVRMAEVPREGAVQFSDAEMDLTTDGQELDAAKGQAAGSVKGTVKLVAQEKIPEQFFVVLRNSKSRVVAAQTVNEKGEFEFPDVTPGRYEVLMQARDKAYWVLRISTQGHETAGSLLDVLPGSPVEVSLTVVGGITKVEGFATRNGHAAAGAMVVLVPANAGASSELFRRDQSDLDGSFTLFDVIPGRYTVCAIEDGWDLDWAKPAIVAHYCEHGPRVIVSGGAPSTTKLQEAVEVQLK